MNEHWEHWIKTSLYKHFRSGLEPAYIWFEGEDRRTDEPPSRYEFRVLGPDFSYLTEDELSAKLVLNIEVITNKNPKEPLRHLKNVGKLQNLFTKCIAIFKYGNDPSVDDDSQVAVIEIDSDIKTTDFGLVDPTARILKTTIEATYAGILT